MIRLTFITEDIESMRKQFPKIEQGLFDTLIQLDPTYQGGKKQGDYTKWMLQLANKNALSDDDVEELPAILAQFKAYRNRIENKDLMRYKSVQELADALAAVVDDDSMLSDRQKVRFHKAQKAGKIVTDARDDYDVVLETSKFIVYVPHTHEASMFLGKGTEWCTAHENPSWYKEYTRNGHKLYIIKEKSTGDRWQYSDKNGDFLDQHDKIFNIVKLMRRDKKLSKFFEKFLGVDIANFDGNWTYTGGQIPEGIHKYVKHITIPDSVTEIGASAFYGCKSLTSITIPDSVTEIGSGAFYSCTSLANITIPDSVTVIGDSAFGFCKPLTNITIPDGVTEIGYGVFQSCYSLTSITIPDSVTKIGGYAFAFCKSLTRTTIPDGVTEIGDNAFYECASLTSVTIPDSVTDIGVSAFRDCKSLTSVTIPDSVTKIGVSAFRGCKSLTSVIIPNSVTDIDDSAFINCKKITVYTDNEYAQDYCEENNIRHEPLSAKRESLQRQFRLRIRE